MAGAGWSNNNCQQPDEETQQGEENTKTNRHGPEKEQPHAFHSHSLHWAQYLSTDYKGGVTGESRGKRYNTGLMWCNFRTLIKLTSKLVQLII